MKYLIKLIINILKIRIKYSFWFVFLINKIEKDNNQFYNCRKLINLLTFDKSRSTKKTLNNKNKQKITYEIFK